MSETEHKRRVHYSGRYPKKFEEKYKEHDPEKYGDTINHVIDKGSTPAGMHISICVDEILEFLQIKPGMQGLDCTLGYGGHSRRMMDCLQGNGHLYALDIDPIESVKTKERLANAGYGDDILTILQTNFADIDQVVNEHGKFDFILADLGVSSMQIDDPSRGFSYKIDGPLDLRMNPEKGISAAQRLSEMDKDEIEAMLVENSDEPFAGLIASEIINARRRKQPIETTTDLKNIVEKALSSRSSGIAESELKDAVKKSCARTFQALRIDINREYEVLYELLSKLPDALNPGGRVAILTFHSGEDRLVKKMFKEHYNEGLYQEIARDVIRPSAQECVRNPRAKSTKMRWAIRA